MPSGRISINFTLKKISISSTPLLQLLVFHTYRARLNIDQTLLNIIFIHFLL
jgi:hypothetical protein